MESTGSPNAINRGCELSIDLALVTTQATAPVVVFKGAAGGQIHIPTGSPITSITVWSGLSPTDTSKFLPLSTDTGSAVTMTVAGGHAYDLPAACFGSAWLQFVVNFAGSVSLILKG